MRFKSHAGQLRWPGVCFPGCHSCLLNRPTPVSAKRVLQHHRGALLLMRCAGRALSTGFSSPRSNSPTAALFSTPGCVVCMGTAISSNRDRCPAFCRIRRVARGNSQAGLTSRGVRTTCGTHTIVGVTVNRAWCKLGKFAVCLVAKMYPVATVENILIPKRKCRQKSRRSKPSGVADRCKGRSR
jgi:hypothetical protein